MGTTRQMLLQQKDILLLTLRDVYSTMPLWNLPTPMEMLEHVLGNLFYSKLSGVLSAHALSFIPWQLGRRLSNHRLHAIRFHSVQI